MSEHSINSRHNTLCPLNRRRNQFVRAGASLRSSEQIVRRPHVQACEDRSHDSDHTFAAFVHLGIVTQVFAFNSLYNCANVAQYTMSTLPQPPAPDQTRELLQFLREENTSYREALRDEGEASRKLLLDTVKFASIPLAVIIAIAAGLGFQSLRDLKQTLQTEARRETKAEITRMQTEIHNTLKDQFQTPALQKMVKEAAGDATKTAAEPLIKTEVATQVKSRVDAERGRIGSAVTEQTHAAVEEMSSKIDSLVKTSVDDRVQSEVEPVLKQVTELKNEADLQTLIIRMNADDAEAFDSLMTMIAAPDPAKRNTIVAALKTVIAAHTEGIIIGRGFTPPLSQEQMVAKLQSNDVFEREAALENIKQQTDLLPQVVSMIRSDPSINVRAAAHRLFNTWTGQQFKLLDKESVLRWWEANKNNLPTQIGPPR